MQTRLEPIDDVEAFLKLDKQWHELLQASAANCPFLSWEWLFTWWKHLSGARTLHLLTVRDGTELIAVAPLSVVRGVPVPFSRLEFLGTGQAGSDHLDFVARADCEAEALNALTQYFRFKKSALYLDHVRTPGSLAESLMQQLAGHRWAVSSGASGLCPYIALEGHSWDSYLATVGSSHRQNVRRRLRAIQVNFDMRFDTVRSDSERREALAALIPLHNQRWSERGGSSAFPTPAHCSFHDEFTRLALERGWLRMYVLRLNGNPVAVQYLLGYNRRFYFYQHGYDSQFNKHSVGLVSFALAIRAAIEEGALEFDMLWGVESYKQLWTDQSRSLLKLDMFPPDFAGALQRRTTETNRTMRAFARRLLNGVRGDVRG